jgi:hypothetical protein
MTKGNKLAIVSLIEMVKIVKTGNFQNWKNVEYSGDLNTGHPNTGNI